MSGYEFCWKGNTVKYSTTVDSCAAVTELDRRSDSDEEVLCLLIEVVDSCAQAVVEETHVETEVDLLSSLPCKVRVRKTVWRRCEV